VGCHSAVPHRQNFPNAPRYCLRRVSLPRSRTTTNITEYSTSTQHGDRIAPALKAAEERGD
jgi:hypothetical protein